MQILDGKALAQQIETEIKSEVGVLSQKGITPGLAVILVGNDPASQSYVNMKAKACKRTGIYSITHEMPENIAQDSLLQTITMLNANPNIDGILVQLPLPKHIDTTAVLEAIAPHKDVDGFHPFNMGRIFANLAGFVPATPMGVLSLLKHYKIEIQGKNVVIVGASNIVGKPLGALFFKRKCDDNSLPYLHARFDCTHKECRYFVCCSGQAKFDYQRNGKTRCNRRRYWNLKATERANCG